MKKLFIFFFVCTFILSCQAYITPAQAQEALTIDGFPLPEYNPIDEGTLTSITNGPDGNLWFTNRNGYSDFQDYIGRITPGGTITAFPLATGGNAPFDITSGPDGNLWFVEIVGKKIGRITTTGVITEFPLTSEFFFPIKITSGSDGNIWFTVRNNSTGMDKIARITPNGVITEFPLAGSNYKLISDITNGPDGNIWFTMESNVSGQIVSSIGRITPAGIITLFPLPNEYNTLQSITSDSDGNIWFTSYYGIIGRNTVGRITPNGVITGFPFTGISNSSIFDITTSLDGKIWITGKLENGPEPEFIQSITQEGVITRYNVSVHCFSITGGPDGNLWCTHDGLDGIFRINLPNTSPSPPTPTPPSQSVAPLMKQTDPDWGSQEYAFANTHGAYNCGKGKTGKTIAQCGCALASAAMLLHYHGFKKLPDGTDINPGTLNTWLKNNNGYDKPSGDLKFSKIAVLSKEALVVNGITSFHGLELDDLRYPGDTSQLKTDLNNGQPDILFDGGHFFLATGVQGNTFTINDPGRNIGTLDNPTYNNTFKNMRRFTVAHTDFSFIEILTEPGVNFKLVDDQGNEVGNQFVQQTITDPNEETSNGSELKHLYFAKPESNNYKLIITGVASASARMSVDIIDKEANDVTYEKQISSGDAFNIVYDKDEVSDSQLTKVVTFESALKDIATLEKNKKINRAVANSLKSIISQSKKKFQKGNKRISLLLINTAIRLLNTSSKNQILVKNEAFQLLSVDFSELKKIISANN